MERRLVGEWQIVGKSGEMPNLLVYPLSDGGLFVYDNFYDRWRSYSAWLSADRDTLFGRQGCLSHYALCLKYRAENDVIVINDTIELKHIKLVPRQLAQ